MEMSKNVCVFIGKHKLNALKQIGKTEGRMKRNGKNAWAFADSSVYYNINTRQKMSRYCQYINIGYILLYKTQTNSKTQLYFFVSFFGGALFRENSVSHSIGLIACNSCWSSTWTFLRISTIFCHFEDFSGFVIPERYRFLIVHVFIIDLEYIQRHLLMPASFSWALIV